MKIGIAGPVSLSDLKYCETDWDNFPAGYDFPPMAVLVNALIERGHEVIVYTTSEGIAEPLVYRGRKMTVCIARRLAHPGRRFFGAERRDLLALMKEYQPDVINAHWTYEFAWAALASATPCLVTVNDHAWTILKLSPDFYRLVRYVMNSVALEKAPFLSVVSDYLFDRLSAVQKKKTRVIYNFSPVDLGPEGGESSERSNFILTVSNGFGRIKNIDSALRAFHIVRQSFPELEYHLIGEGMEMNGAAHKFAEANGLLPGVRFLGKQPSSVVQKRLRTSKMLLHPAREESFGMSVLEAMVAGAPIVAGVRSGNIPFLLDGGRAGVLCDVESPAAMAEAVTAMLRNDAGSRSLARRARCLAQKKYALDAIVPQYENYYEAIVDHGE